MKLAYFPNQIALNAQPVLNSFLNGCKSLGVECISNSQDADAAVIWSVVWMGRMRQNRAVYEHYRNQKKPVFILEVGSLRRNVTWKVALNNINSDGIFPIDDGNVTDRENILGINLQPPKIHRQAEILIASQQQHSHQWNGMPLMTTWVEKTIEEIRKFSSRPIVVRPHPRSSIKMRSVGNIVVDFPRRIPGATDNYNLDHNFHCVVNWNSGVAIQSAIAGTPIITGPTSLAHEISGKYENIEQLQLPDRRQWFEKILHTEWLVEELAQGTPQKILFNKI
jgi:hypothetical protein